MDLCIVVVGSFSFLSVGMNTIRNCLETWLKDCIAVQLPKNPTSRVLAFMSDSGMVDSWTWDNRLWGVGYHPMGCKHVSK